jgi:uncharacterized protein (DUF849 family)
MNNEVIVTCAVTGGGDTVGKHPAIPKTPKEIADAVIEAANAGASVAHIHVRDPETGAPTRDPALFRDVFERVRGSTTDVVINLTGGGGGRWTPGDDDPAVGHPDSTLALPEDRVVHIEELLPEICSLDCGTMNFGEHIFMNTEAHTRVMAQRIQACGVKPELEVFDSGHLQMANQLVADGLVDGTPLYQICLGIPWGAPADMAAMIAMRDMLPPGAHWASFGISRLEMPMVAQAVLLGGNVRVGLEDNLYLERGVFATNGKLVEKAIRIIEAMGARVLSPAETREKLELRKRN